MDLIAVFRFIDYWIGIPLCFLLTPFHYLRRIWQPSSRQSSSDPQRILVIKLAELGAIVQAYPFFKKINDDYPHAKIYVVTFSKNKEIFALFDGFIKIEKLIIIREDGLFNLIKDFWCALLTFSTLKIDVSIDLEFFARSSALLTFFSGAPTTIGFYAYGFEGLYRGDFLTHKITYNPFKHVTINYLSLISALKYPSKTTPELDYIDSSLISFPAYPSCSATRSNLTRLGIPKDKNIFLMNVGEGTIPTREWPLENFKLLAQSILQNEQNIILLVGTTGAQVKANQFMKELNNEGMKNYCGQTNLKELMELFLISDTLITNDGGLAHLAVLTPLKILVFFGPETPAVFAPLGPNVQVFYSHWPCSPCLSALNHRYSSCNDNKCLQAIKPQHVIEIIKKLK